MRGSSLNGQRTVVSNFVILCKDLYYGAGLTESLSDRVAGGAKFFVALRENSQSKTIYCNILGSRKKVEREE